MLKYYLAALASMLRSSSRLHGRPWLAEFICRTFKIVLQAPENKSLPRLRRLIDAASAYHPALSKVKFKDDKFANVACLVATPKNTSNAETVIIYLHGGGYVFGSPKGYKPLLAQLAINSQAMVIAVDYRLAPEHPYPAPQDDCLAAIKAAFKQSSDCKKIIAGDSAGGALTIMSALALHNDGQPADGCCLLSPWVDPLASEGSMITNQTHDFLNHELLNQSIQDLMQDHQPTQQIRFNDVDLSTLPPTLLQCGTGEIFFDQIQHFADRAKQAGVKLSLQNTPNQFHVFQLLSPLLKDARQAVREIGGFINTL